ncbi:MAG: tetratricopeptide repeat protein [Thermoanaerobaculia bacterium]|nr:tetratricopeptide repeat protein [Thermoanaerobaculia bacterium]
MRLRTLGPDHPSSLESMNNFTDTYYNQGRFDKVDNSRQDVLKMKQRVEGTSHPDTLVSMRILASAYYGQGRCDEAAKLHRETLEARHRALDPDPPNVFWSLFSLAATYDTLGRFVEALELARESLKGYKTKKLEKTSETGYARLALGRALLGLNRSAAAEAELLAAEPLAGAQTRPPARRTLAPVLCSLLAFVTACGPLSQSQWLAKYDGDIREATTAIATARDGIEQARGYSARGRAYAEKARYSRAMRIISPEDYRKLFGQALDDHDRAVALAPQDSQIHFERGKSNYDRAAYADPGDAESRACFGTALADFTLAVKRDSSNSEALEMRGLVNTALGDHDHAIEDFTGLMALDPRRGRLRLADTYCRRGGSRTEAKAYGQAIGDYEKAVELGASADACDCQPHSPLAGLYLETKQYDKSWEVVRKARLSGKWIMPETLQRLKTESGRSE